MVSSAISLNEDTLAQMSERVRAPRYSRKRITTGIVHFGVGGFHRAHQALYLDRYLEKEILEKGESQWGICGVGLLKYDQKMRDVLRSQDCLYTLVERSVEKDTARVIGSIAEYLFAPDEPQAVIDKLASDEVKIVTLTITEGGYFVIEGTGEFDEQHPTIQHDLQHLDCPIGVYGFLAAALKRRRENELPPFTVLSCDNVQGNGSIVRKMLLSFVRLVDEDLARWIEENGAFPNSMVDRITPATTAADVEMVSEQFGVKDSWPVVAEPFLQWVVEDTFCLGRPQWEVVGVQMTSDVHPYERMKIRLLNASHLLIGYLGSLLDYIYTSEAMADELIKLAAERLMDEVSPTLEVLPGVDVSEYKQTLLTRFSNPKVRDQLARLCLNSSDKLPKFLLGSLKDNLEKGDSIEYMSLTVAAWFRYLSGMSDAGKPLPIDDPMADVLIAKAQAAEDPLNALLSIKELFGHLSDSERFVKAVEDYFRQLNNFGTKGTLEKLLGS